MAPRLRTELDSGRSKLNKNQGGKGREKAGTSGTRRTRNQGKRTVRYQEDSDYEYGDSSVSSSHRTRKRARIMVSDEDSDTEESDGNSEVMRSSRGRIRKLTPRAMASLRQ